MEGFIKNDHDVKVREARAFFRAFPNRQSARLLLAEMLALAEKNEEARVHLERILDESDLAVEARLDLAVLEAEEGRVAAAREQLATAATAVARLLDDLSQKADSIAGYLRLPASFPTDLMAIVLRHDGAEASRFVRSHVRRKPRRHLRLVNPTS